MINNRVGYFRRFVSRLSVVIFLLAFCVMGGGMVFSGIVVPVGYRFLIAGEVGFEQTGEKAASVAGTGGQDGNQTGFDKALALATFDFAWKLVRDSYFRKDMNGVDWDAVRAELRPKVEEVTSNSQLRVILQDMVGRLHQSHFEVIPGDRARRKMAETARNAESSRGEDHEEGQGAASGKSDATGERDHGEKSEADKNEKSNHEAGEVKKSGGGGVAAREGSSSSVVDEGRVNDGGDDNPVPTIKDTKKGGRKTIGSLGIDTRVIDDEVVVTRVLPGGAGDKAGVRAGWEINFIGATPMKNMLQSLRDEGYGESIGLYGWQAVTSMLSGRVGSKRTIRFIDGKGVERSLTLVREKGPGQVVKFGNLPPLNVVTTSREEDFEGVEVGIIRFSMWMFPVIQPFGRAMEKFADAGGIILDLRGNVGGIGGMVMGIGGYFFDKPISLGTMFQRGQKLKFNVNPRGVSISGKRRDTYRGSVAILIDGESASTTEMFAAGMQATGRARIFGAVSAGMALPAVATKLPNGDILLHAIADFEDPNGVSIEGRGVIPDEKIVLSRARLLAGHDDTMEAALRWVAENRDWRWGG